MTTLPTNNRGFIALMSAIIISLILLGFVFTVSESGYFARFNVLNTEYKRVALGLAESCQNIALLKFSQNYNYTPATGGDMVSVGTDAQGRGETCTIKSLIPISTGAAQKILTISTQGQYQGAFSNISVQTTIEDPTVIQNTAMIWVTAVVIPSGGNRPSFSLSLDSNPVTPGYPVNITPGTHTVRATTPGGYTASPWSGDCNSAGSVSTTLNTNYACQINFTLQKTTVDIILIANIPAGADSTKFPLTLDSFAATSGVSTTTVAGSHAIGYNMPASGYSTNGWDCTNTGTITLSQGQSQTCVVTFSQPGPACADTVMMLDRTGSMGGPGSQIGTDLFNEKAAATALVNLYAGVTPAPKLGVGVFGDGSDNNGLAPAQIVGQLTTNFASLTSVINTWLANSEGTTNLADAINKANAELGGIRHDTNKQKVLILVSDGGTNRPNDPYTVALNAADAAKLSGTQIFTIHFGSTGFKGSKSDQNFLATLASGQSPVPGHQPGSANDQPTAIAENSDGDNFFISPTASDMQGIFQTIGKIACPAAVPATKGTLKVNNYVINDSGGTKSPADFTLTVKNSSNTVITPTASNFSGDGTSVTYVYSNLATDNYSISETGPTGYYYPPYYSGCFASGNAISSGQTLNCTIINYDTPPQSVAPPPPPQSSNITIGSWQETTSSP